MRSDWAGTMREDFSSHQKKGASPWLIEELCRDQSVCAFSRLPGLSPVSCEQGVAMRLSFSMTKRVSRS